MKIYSNEAHGLRLLDHQRDSYERTMQFLDRHLSAGAATPTREKQ